MFIPLPLSFGFRLERVCFYVRRAKDSDTDIREAQFASLQKGTLSIRRQILFFVVQSQFVHFR